MVDADKRRRGAGAEAIDPRQGKLVRGGLAGLAADDAR